MLRQVATFCRPLRLVLLLVSSPHLRSPVVGVLGLCWMWHDVPFARHRHPVVGVLTVCLLLWRAFDCVYCLHTSVLRPSTTCLAVFLCGPGALFLNVLSRPSTTYAPLLRGSRVHRTRSLLVAGSLCFTGGVRSIMVDAGGMRTCMVSRVIYAARWPHRHPWFCPPRFCRRAHHSFPQGASGAQAVAHWVLDPRGADEQRHCAAGAPGLAPWVPDPLRTGGSAERIRGPSGGPLGAGSPPST